MSDPLSKEPFDDAIKKLHAVRHDLLHLKWTGSENYPEFAVKAIEVALDALQAPDTEKVVRNGNERIAELNALAEQVSAAIDRTVPTVEKSPVFDRLSEQTAHTRNAEVVEKAVAWHANIADVKASLAPTQYLMNPLETELYDAVERRERG